jgi:hypothetical protein
MRVIAVFVLAALLAACSGSDRVEHIVPAWANTPARAAPQYAAPQYAARKDRAEEHGKPLAEPPSPKPGAEPQPASPPRVQDHSEE